MNRNNKIVLSLLLTAYLVIVFIFGVSISQLSGSYMQMEKRYLETIQLKLGELLNSVQSEEQLVTQIDSLIQEYPMELSIFDKDEVVYATLDLSREEVRDSINRDATLVNSQGTFPIGGKDYYILYNVYHMSGSTYISELIKWQFMLLGIAIFVLLTISFVMQRMLFRPLQKVEENIENMENFQFDKILVQESSDGVNQKLRDFAFNMNDNIQKVERNYTELESALQIERERLNNTITVSRAFIHDLKSPLHQTMLENELVTQKIIDIDPVTKKILAYNVDRVEDVIFQINEILKVMDANMYDIEKQTESVDIVKIIKVARNMFRPSMVERDVYLSLDVPEEYFLEINVPTFKLLIHNILSNAVTYARQASEITFELFEDNDEIVLWCTNEATKKDIERMQRSESLFNSDVKNSGGNKYSSGNGLFLIKELSLTFGGRYQLLLDEETVTVEVRLVGGANDAKEHEV